MANGGGSFGSHIIFPSYSIRLGYQKRIAHATSLLSPRGCFGRPWFGRCGPSSISRSESGMEIGPTGTQRNTRQANRTRCSSRTAISSGDFEVLTSLGRERLSCVKRCAAAAQRQRHPHPRHAGRFLHTSCLDQYCLRVHNSCHTEGPLGLRGDRTSNSPELIAVIEEQRDQLACPV